MQDPCINCDILEKRNSYLVHYRNEFSIKNKHFQHLYETTSIGLFHTRIDDDKLMWCNEALTQILGYSDKEQCLNNCSIFHIIDSAEKQQLIEKLKNHMSIESFEVFIRANGKLIWVEINADYFPNLGLVKGQMRDVSITKLLTVTEKQILKFVMQGKSNSEIACDAKRSTRTIECHRAKIMKKLGVSNVVELAKKALFSK